MVFISYPKNIFTALAKAMEANAGNAANIPGFIFRIIY